MKRIISDTEIMKLRLELLNEAEDLPEGSVIEIITKSEPFRKEMIALRPLAESNPDAFLEAVRSLIKRGSND